MQKLRYVLYGLVGNHFNIHVFMKNGLLVDLVSCHLELENPVPERNFIALRVSIVCCPSVCTCVLKLLFAKVGCKA